MIIGLLSDLHWKISRRNNNFIKHVEQAIDYFLEECKKHEVERVGILGDVWDIKYSVDTVLLSKCLDSMRKIMNTYPTFALTGNHETVNRNNHDYNLMKIFAKDCRVIEDYEYEDIDNSMRFHYMPYFVDNILKEKLQQIKLGLNNNVMFGHFGFINFKYTENHENIFSGMKHNDVLFKNIDYIYSGHYHSYQTKDNVTYVSSPLESKFGEGGQHGFVFIDTDDYENYEFIENKYSPKFIQIELRKNNLHEMFQIKNAYLKIKVKNNIDIKLQTKIRDKLLEHNYFVMFDFDIESKLSKIGSIDGWDSFIYDEPHEIISKYVDNVNTSFDKKLLKEIILE